MQASTPILQDLPLEIQNLLEQLQAPTQLVKHLTLVHHTAFLLLNELKQVFPDHQIQESLVLFGAATHDIGKIEIPTELHSKGNKHEKAGRTMLLELGIPIQKARFAYTHGNWNEPQITLEDITVSLADKLWKGKRVLDLEELFCKSLSEQLQKNYWTVYTAVDPFFEKLCLQADSNIIWQKS